MAGIAQAFANYCVPDRDVMERRMPEINIPIYCPTNWAMVNNYIENILSIGIDTNTIAIAKFRSIEFIAYAYTQMLNQNVMCVDE